MDEDTPRLALPLLAAGQAQKEVAHNEALARLDIAVQAAVLGIGRDDPPAAPGTGDCWIVGTAPVGAWAGKAHALAGWTDGGWRFVAPCAGMRVWDVATGRDARYEGEPGDWRVGFLSGASLSIDGVQVVGSQRPAIADPGGGATVDAEARGTIAAVLAAMRAHGLIHD